MVVGPYAGRIAYLGDMDYNDLVLHVSRTPDPVPLPPTALLLGSGLVALVGLRRWRKNV